MKKSILALTISLLTTLSLSAQTAFVNVLESPTTIVLDGIFKDFNLHKGVAKTAIPISLPKDTEGFYYKITVLPPNAKKDKSSGLLNQIQHISSQSPQAQIQDQISTYKTGRETNIYLIHGRENANGFENYNYFEYHEKFIGYKSFCGYIKSDDRSDFYIAIENKYELKKVKIILEVVAEKNKY